MLNLEAGGIMKHRLSNRVFSNRGFTLIEIMVVIIILGILAGLLVPRIMGRPEEAKQLKAKVQIEGMETALKLYKLDNGAYPDTQQGLQALVEFLRQGPYPRIGERADILKKTRSL